MNLGRAAPFISETLVSQRLGTMGEPRRIHDHITASPGQGSLYLFVDWMTESIVSEAMHQRRLASEAACAECRRSVRPFQEPLDDTDTPFTGSGFVATKRFLAQV